jgi:transcription elongation factor Elf1
MGCFDTVLVPCPNCSAREEVQTKAGDCSLRVFDLSEDVPANVLAGAADQGPFTCSDCGTKFEIKVHAAGRSVKFREED